MHKENMLKYVEIWGIVFCVDNI